MTHLEVERALGSDSLWCRRLAGPIKSYPALRGRLRHVERRVKEKEIDLHLVLPTRSIEIDRTSAKILLFPSHTEASSSGPVPEAVIQGHEVFAMGYRAPGFQKFRCIYSPLWDG